MKKITLKNLHEATAQEVFDQCAVHLLTQNKKCTIEGRGCRYRSQELKCAAGCFIDEHEYDPSIEGVGWFNLASQKLVPDFHVDLIHELQKVHDISNEEVWKIKLLELALRKKLNTNAINNLN